MTRREAYHQMALAVMRCPAPSYLVEIAVAFLWRREMAQARYGATERRNGWRRKWEPRLAKACGEERT